MVKLSIFKVSFSNLPVLLNIIILVFFSLIVSPHLSELNIFSREVTHLERHFMLEFESNILSHLLILLGKVE